MSTSAIMLAKGLIPLVIIVGIISCASLTGSDFIIPEKQVALTLSDYFFLAQWGFRLLVTLGLLFVPDGQGLYNDGPYLQWSMFKTVDSGEN